MGDIVMFERIFILLIIISILLVSSCSGGEMENKKETYNNLKDVPIKAWNKLSKEKIFFGHQSVGYNILDGVKDLINEYPDIKLKIEKTTDLKNTSEAVFMHSEVGQNTDPKSKINDFKKKLESNIGKNVDIAALKLCYIDINRKTDVDQLFNEYKIEIEKIKKKFPNLKIIHFTEPLKINETGWKTTIKKIFGREIDSIADNMKRCQYNEILKKEYMGKEPVLDIAQIESTFSDGRRSSFEKDGKLYYSLVPEYTYDGGHLNAIGRKKVAEQFLLLLVNI